MSGDERREKIEKPKGLIVREPYASMIVSGEKKWEIRKQRTRHRGEVYIISNGRALGRVNLVDVKGPFTPEELRDHEDKHRAPYEFLRRYGRRLYVWVMEVIERFEKPKKIRMKKGAQTWVRDFEILEE